MRAAAGRSASAGPRLLVACALAVEHLALLSGARVDGRSVTLVRTGMGPRPARRAVARALRAEPAPGATAVAATGFCAGLLPGMRAGDLVLATETRDGATATPCTGVSELAALLAPLRRRLHTGPLAGSDHVVHGAERAALRTVGAVAVDMESAAVLRTAARGAPRRPVAAVRVVVDAPGRELWRLGTLTGGISAFRVLSTLLPVLHAWHRSPQLSRR